MSTHFGQDLEYILAYNLPSPFSKERKITTSELYTLYKACDFKFLKKICQRDVCAKTTRFSRFSKGEKALSVRLKNDIF